MSDPITDTPMEDYEGCPECGDDCERPNSSAERGDPDFGEYECAACDLCFYVNPTRISSRGVLAANRPITDTPTSDLRALRAAIHDARVLYFHLCDEEQCPRCARHTDEILNAVLAVPLVAHALQEQTQRIETVQAQRAKGWPVPTPPNTDVREEIVKAVQQAQCDYKWADPRERLFVQQAFVIADAVLAVPSVASALTLRQTHERDIVDLRQANDGLRRRMEAALAERDRLRVELANATAMMEAIAVSADRLRAVVEENPL